ncbi:MAG TPA: FHA domain-containing protein, partial [Ilumatobacteraceae bacterium]|nr:FHA domain-containing protein [Ilumatobacteraceae bacterium]
MTDTLLGILKYALLALLYLFFARVLWAVWSEVRGPRAASVRMRTADGVVAPIGQQRGAARPGKHANPGKPPKPAPVAKGRHGAVARLLVLEPSDSRGTALSVANEITFGRAPGCTVSVPDDAYVSQVHARVFNDRGDVTVEDLGSTNGTYVN